MKQRQGIADQAATLARNMVEEWGYCAALLVESFYWLLVGPGIRQSVRVSLVLTEMMSIGLTAVPILAILAFSVGVMLAIQGVYSLRAFGAESQVVMAVVLSITREFGALMAGILVAGRSGSALAARIGAMQISQEVDALCVMGINPVRHLVAPPLVASLVMVPSLTVLADIFAVLGGAVYCKLELGLSFEGFVSQALAVLRVSDLVQGITKGFVFALIISLVGVCNGFSVTGGADGVGRATTRAVVQSLSYIVMADMVFTYFLSR
jgi:phospholipid/cholesterol/gamma-HCH transport system permease protein